MAATRDDARQGPGEAPGAGLLVPNFEITGELGSGIRGTVYVASDGKRTLAVKVLRRGINADLKTLERFSRGAPDRIRHPNLVPIEIAGELSNGCVYYAMPLLRGDSFEHLLADLKRGATDRPSLTAFSVGPDGEVHPQLPRRAAELFAEAADGLALAHREGIVHRRLGPRNLLLTPAGRLIVTDFGGDATTEGGDSLVYRAPEQLDPFPDAVGPAADVYALGAILYEALTRSVPFHAASPRDLKEKIQQGDFPRPREVAPELPPHLEACILKAMSLEPEDRYQDAGELAEDLRRFLRDEAPAAAAVKPNEKGRKPFLSRVALLRTAAACLCVGVIALAWWVDRQLSFGQGEKQDSARGAGLVALNPGHAASTPTELEPRAAWLGERTSSSRPRPAPEPNADSLTRDLSGENLPAQVAGLTRLQRDIASGARPREDALLAAWLLHAPSEEIRARAIETMALAGRSGPILRLLPLGEGEPITTIGERSFLSLFESLTNIRDDGAVQTACAWDLSEAESLDQAPRPAQMRLAPNLRIALEGEPSNAISTEWLRSRAMFDPRGLLDAVPALLRREELAQALISALETAAVEAPAIAPEARAAIARAAREQCLTAGATALASLSRLGAHGEILELARSRLPLELRARALRALGEEFAGLYLGELRAFALTSPEPELRKAAFEPLSAFDEPEAVLAIPGASQDEELKSAAIAWLGRLHPDAAANVNLELLSHPDAEVRTLAAERLALSRRADLLLPLASRLLEPRSDARAAAFDALVDRGDLTRIPGAMAVIFGSPSYVLFEEPELFLEGLAAAVRRFALGMDRASGDARAAFARLLDQSGVASILSSLSRAPESH